MSGSFRIAQEAYPLEPSSVLRITMLFKKVTTNFTTSEFENRTRENSPVTSNHYLYAMNLLKRHPFPGRNFGLNQQILISISLSHL